MAKMGFTKATAANFISLVFVGWAIASPLWGIYSNRIGLRKPPLYIGCIGALITSILFIYTPGISSWFLAILLLAFGIFSSGFLPAFAVAKEICNKRYVATGLSFMNMMNMIGIALAQPLIGYVLDKSWAGSVIDGVRYYPVSAYQTALMLLPAGIFVALLIMPFLKETYCHSADSKH
jgi:MFS family permease